MLTPRTSAALLALVLLAPLLPAAEPVAPHLVATPRARTLPLTPTNRPFLAAANTQQPMALSARGYAESELIVSGYANIYEWAGTPADAAVTVRNADVPYATRVLVRRPVDPAKASGLVVVELLNPTGLYDFAPLWGFSWEHFTRRGDVWVGITVKPVAAETLRRFDPVRYASLSFSFRQAPECRPAATAAGMPGAGDDRNTPADAENGLAFDLIAQVGALLRSSSKENPLLDLNPRKLVVAGYSQSGGYITTYANAMHRMLRRGDGAPVYDGYLKAASGPSNVPINQCAAPLPEDDPRRAAMPRDVPFVTVMTESDFNRGTSLALRRDDTDAAEGHFHLYEVPGSGHAGPFAAGVPADADLRIAGFEPPAKGMCMEPDGDFPVGMAFSAIWQQYDEWMNKGTPMLVVPRIETDAQGAVVPDANGNAKGGWRLPPLDVPAARYAGRGTPREDTDRARALCALTGIRQPFDAARMKALYRNRAEYVRQFNAAVDQAVQQRRLTAEDGAALKAPVVRSLPAF
ncbi:MAG: alpha/beta hydrolase domain-containing protein [Steroidobacteraceae bacterium]